MKKNKDNKKGCMDKNHLKPHNDQLGENASEEFKSEDYNNAIRRGKGKQ